MQISGVSAQPCPITKEVDPSVTNYDLSGAQQQPNQKLIPLIAVVGTPAPFAMDNNFVKADLDQNGKTQTFRACSADDGVHLTVWGGNPVDGALLWHGYYYEASNPGLGPACTPKEMTHPPA
jgi:hypothetical protein